MHQLCTLYKLNNELDYFQTNIDFDFLYPGKSNQINENWPKVRIALLQKVIRSIKTIDFLQKTEGICHSFSSFP